jgi:hypothetical protein
MKRELLSPLERAQILTDRLLNLVAGRGDYTQAEREAEIEDCERSLCEAIDAMGALH